jgi:hypothetical protein
VDQKNVKKRNGTRRTWFMHGSATSSCREESWVILERGGWLPGVLCDTAEFVSVELAELDQVGAGGCWRDRALVCEPNVAPAMCGCEGSGCSSRNWTTDEARWRWRNRGREREPAGDGKSLSDKSGHP